MPCSPRSRRGAGQCVSAGPGAKATTCTGGELADRTDVVGAVICHAMIGQRLGNIALRHDGKTGEVSYWVDAGARGRGVATRALRLLSDWAFAALELSEIGLWTHVDNAASRFVGGDVECAAAHHLPSRELTEDGR